MAYQYNTSAPAIQPPGQGARNCSVTYDIGTPIPPTKPPTPPDGSGGGGGGGEGSNPPIPDDQESPNNSQPDPCEDCKDCKDSSEKETSCCSEGSESENEPPSSPSTPVDTSGFYDIGGTCSLNFKVKLFTGQLFISVNICSESTNSVVPLDLSIMYRSKCDQNNLFGTGWNHSYNMFVVEYEDNIYFYNYDGRLYFFEYDSDNEEYISPLFNGMTAVMTKENGLPRLTYPSGTYFQFHSNGRLDYIQSPEHIQLKVIYNAKWQPTEIQAIDSTDENYLRTVKFNIDSSTQLITDVTDPDGEQTVFQYNSLMQLTDINQPLGCNVHFDYNGKGKVTRIRDGEGKDYKFTYNSEDYITKYTEAPGTDVERSLGFQFEVADPGPPTFNIYVTDFSDRTTKILYRENNRPHRFYTPDDKVVQWSAAAHNYYFQQHNMDETNKFVYHDYTGNFFDKNCRTQGHIRLNLNEDWRGSSYLYDSQFRRTAQYDMNIDIATLGNWTDGTTKVYGKDGYILCSWNDDWTDVTELPSYVTSVTTQDKVQFRPGLPYGELGLRDPDDPYTRKYGGWDTAAEKDSFTITVNFEEGAPSCDISLYSYSWLGSIREFDIIVTDQNGTQTLYAHNNINSIYCRFSVEPDNDNKVVIKLQGLVNDRFTILPSIAGMFFDPRDTRWTRYEYTDANYPKKVTKTTDAYGNESTTQYNADGTVAQSTNFRGKTTKYTYTDDSYARITCVEDPLGNKTWTNYDSKGRVVSTVDARGTGPDDEDHMTQNEYDDDGSLISVTDPLGNKTTYQYDGEGNLVSQTDPTGWITYYNTDDDSGTTEVKDALGRVISSTDKDGNTTYYQYDADSHLIKITDPNGAISTNTYDSMGRLTASSDFEGNITRYEYDAMGRTTKTTVPNGDETSYQYDVKGRITKTTYPDETYTETTYDIYYNGPNISDKKFGLSKV